MAENDLAQLPEEVGQEINGREIINPENIDSAKKKFENYLYGYENSSEEIDEELVEIIDNPKKPFLITTEKAREDVNFY